MRIGVVTASYPRTPGEAAGSFVAAHADAMRALGHDVEVIGAHNVGTHVTSDAALFYAGGAPDALERGGARTYLSAVRFTAQLTTAVARRARDWDLAIAHWLAPSALAVLPARVPLVAIAHGGDIHTLRRLRLLAPALYALRARGARLVFVTEELRGIARVAAPGLDRYLDAAIVQPMGIDVGHFAALGRVPASPPQILVVARLVPVKGVDVAIEAFQRVTTPAELVIAGDGPARVALEWMAEAGRGTIRFCGAVDAAMRDRLLRTASVVVIPSRVLGNGRTEGSPMIALEALAANVPVVASAVGGLRELPGITRVSPDDPAALADAIDAALASKRPPRVDMTALDMRHVAARVLAHANGSAKPATRTDGAVRNQLRSTVRPMRS
jgi:glycosyltransferase involved in cell wall biosynthesis